MRLIRAGKVIFTDEIAPEEEPVDDCIVPLTREERESLDIYARAERKIAQEHARIELQTARRVTFKHTEPKSIYSPAGHCMIKREAPAYKEKGERQGHWERARIRPWNSPHIVRPANKGMGR